MFEEVGSLHCSFFETPFINELTESSFKIIEVPLVDVETIGKVDIGSWLYSFPRDTADLFSNSFL